MNRRLLGFTLGGLLVAFLLAGVVSNFASAHPDGLDSSLRAGCTFDADDNITGGSCPAQRAREHELADGLLADYGISGIDNPYLSTGLAGVSGVLLTFALGAGLLRLARRGTPAGSTTGAPAGAAGPGGIGAPTCAAEPTRAAELTCAEPTAVDSTAAGDPVAAGSGPRFDRPAR